MLVVGLTGSIGMGKSTTARLFESFGVPVFDADRAVHDLMAPGGAAVAPVLNAFPDTGDRTSGIDRRRLGAAVLGNDAALCRLEDILHPRVRLAEAGFLARTCRNGDPLALLDIPLLFETGRERRCDATVVVTAPGWLQRQRVLGRPGMTAARFAGILAKQVPDREKRRRADRLIQTGAGLAFALADVRAALVDLGERPARAWPARWLAGSNARSRR
ncbi:MAG: dephospho-CoA kinase [Pseudomonadota bacterium]